METQVPCRVEDRITLENLKGIEAMFKEADKDGSGELDMKEFREAMKGIMRDVEDEDLDSLFMKVDTNCDGTVDWVEYMDYMRLAVCGKDALQKQNLPLYFPKPLKTVPVAHCRPIVGLQFYSFKSRAAQASCLGEQERSAPKTGAQSGGYLSISQDGILNYWSDRFQLTRSIRLDLLKKSQDVIAMVCLSNLNLLAIASTMRNIAFYKIGVGSHVFSLTGLENWAIIMDYWSEGSKGVFSFCDTDGSLYVFISQDVIQNGLFNTGAFKSASICHIPVSALLKNNSEIYLCFRVELHASWCYQVRFLPKLNSVATCCPSEHTSMVLTNVPDSHKAKIRNSRFHVRKGILCFDYCPECNVLVTGGFDQTLRIWSPYITNEPTSAMNGHMAAIIHIAINSQDSRVISVAIDKNVRVWDLQDCVCLQSIPSEDITLGQMLISSVYYNKDKNTLILATSMIGVLDGTVDGVHTSDKVKTSHEQPLCAVLYNSNFTQVVSGCRKGVVSVWDIRTGEKVMQFQTSPDKPTEITAMAFDGPKRRLITGSQDGTLRLWNFNNGALLRTLPLLDNNEITGILYINQRIYVSGWSKRVMWYLDTRMAHEMEYDIWKQYHDEDIESMHASSNMLVTGSYNGDIVIWSIYSGQVFLHFNPSKSPRPLTNLFTSTEKETTRDNFITGLQGGEQRFSKVESSNLEKKWSNLEKKSTNDLPSLQYKLHKDKPNLINPEELAVEKVLFLCTRERCPDTASLLTCASDGYVYAWSVHHQGGLLGKFQAVHTENTAVTSGFTDSQDQILLTGDSQGYVTIWDIKDYCYCMRGDNPTQKESSVLLPRIVPKYCQPEAPCKRTLKQDTVEIDGWTVSLTPPPMLSSWQCHQKRIVSLEYVERFQLIVTASLDCNVRLWTIAGDCIGTFGQTLWHVADPKESPQEMPLHLRKVGSCQMSEVFNKGAQPHLKSMFKMDQDDLDFVIRKPHLNLKPQPIQAKLQVYHLLPIYDLEPVGPPPPMPKATEEMTTEEPGWIQQPGKAMVLRSN